MRFRRSCKEGKTALLIVDMPRLMPLNRKAKDTFSRMEYRSEFRKHKAAANICETLKLANKLEMEVILTTELNQPVNSKIMDYAMVRPINKEKGDALAQPEVLELLKEKEIKNIIVCGFSQMDCVAKTVAGAKERSFGVITALDLMCGGARTTRLMHYLKNSDLYFRIENLHTAMRGLSQQ
jgi:nicotinamidase-related amidase